MCLSDNSTKKNTMRCCCGMDCAQCLIYRATVRDDDGLRAEAQNYYRQNLGLELPLEAFSCLGVFSQTVFSLCRECPWVKCCEKHGIASCEVCENYPCPEIQEYLAGYVEPYREACDKRK